MPVYTRLPIAFERGLGAWLWDEAGNQYLDALSGIAVCSLGHAHPVVAEAISDQVRKLVHTSNIYRISLQEELAWRLTQLSGMEKAFFCNSGAEANEAAFKIARLYGHRKGIANPVIVVMEGSFHGRTLATLSATGSRKVQAGFEPLVQGFARAAYNDLEGLTAVAANCPDVVAVLLEPVQSEGGIVVPDPGYLMGVRALCDENAWLMMLDEVQTAMCRTGRWFACQHEDVLPDVMTLAKSLGNGVPIGACLARHPAAGLFQPGSHGSTFGGNPLACRAAIAVLKVLDEEKLADRAARLGSIVLGRLRDELSDVDIVCDVRGKGMMIGVQLYCPCAELVDRALEQGLLINVTAEKVVRLLPPLIIRDEELDRMIEGVVTVIRTFADPKRSEPES